VEFGAVAEIVDGYPHMRRKRALEIYNHVIKHELHDILELRTYHGISTCYSAAAVDEVGAGRVTTMDRTSAGQLEPNVFSLLEDCGLTSIVDVILAERSFTWELKKLLVLPERPQFDLVFLDAGHDWDATGFAYFLVDLLLKPGGWLLFDDLNWTVAGSPSIGNEPWVQEIPVEQREAQQVRAVFEALVARNPSYETRTDGNWGWARKVTDRSLSERSADLARSLKRRVARGD
jgi:predicted O-methyltransferase YrrM